MCDSCGCGDPENVVERQAPMRMPSSPGGDRGASLATTPALPAMSRPDVTTGQKPPEPCAPGLDEAAAHARPTLVPHSSHTRPTNRGTQRGSTVTHGQDEVSNRPAFPQVTAHSRISADVPSTGLEPVAYRLGGGRSIHLSYEGTTRNVEHVRTAASHRMHVDRPHRQPWARRGKPAGDEDCPEPPSASRPASTGSSTSPVRLAVRSPA